MPSKLKDYRGYRAHVEYDADDEIFVGRVADIRDGVGFHAATEGDLQAAFHDAVDDYIETCARIGKEPQVAHVTARAIHVNDLSPKEAADLISALERSITQD